jgi:putative ABC transport system permease protein
VRSSNLLHLYRVRLRARLAQELLALAGIAVGVALLYSASVANTSLTGSIDELTAGVVGKARLELAARAPQGFDDALLGKVERLPGVRVAMPVVEAPALVAGPRGRRSVELVGGDPRSAQLGGTLLRQFTAERLVRARAVALPAPIARAIGVSLIAPVRIEVAGRVTQAPLGAQLHVEDIGPLVDSPVVIAPLVFAQQLAGREGRLTRIFVQPQTGRDAEVAAGLRRIAGDRLNVRAARFDAELFDRAAQPSRDSAQMFSAFSALVGFVFAFSAMLLTVPQRRRMIADLRLDGYGPLAVLQVLLFDALLLGLAASALGLLLGDQISRHVFRADPGYLAYTFPVGSQRVVTWHAIAVALGGGMLAAFVAVLSPFRGMLAIGRRRVAGDARRVAGGRSALQLGGAVLALVVTTLILLLAPQLAVLGMGTLTVALLLVLSPTLAATLRALERVTRNSRSATPFLVTTALSSRTNRSRALAVAATGAIAVMSSVAIQGSRQDLQRGLDASARHVDSIADIWVAPRSEANTFATTAFRGGLAHDLRAVAGVHAVRVYRGGFLDWNDRRVWVLAPPRAAVLPISREQMTDAELARARTRIRDGGWGVLSRALADEHHLAVGDVFTTPTAVPTRLRVAALSSNLGWPSGAMILNADDYARAWGSPDLSAYHLVLAPNARPEGVRRAVVRALGPDSAFAVETAAERERRHFATTRDALARLTQIRTLVLVAAVLAMATTMGGMIWQRRPRFAGLKVDGFTDREVWRSLVLESTVLLGAACLLGALFGLYGQVVLSHALATITGFPLVFSVGALVAVGSFALVTLVAVAMIAIPGYLAARVSPAVTLQD